YFINNTQKSHDYEKTNLIEGNFSLYDIYSNRVGKIIIHSAYDGLCIDISAQAWNGSDYFNNQYNYNQIEYKDLIFKKREENTESFYYTSENNNSFIILNIPDESRSWIHGQKRNDSLFALFIINSESFNTYMENSPHYISLIKHFFATMEDGIYCCVF
ncbi:MAG: hypothetical protein K6G09_07485, partial [Treponema sp.]|nr:hypothetical protein [Treponema sp.]